MAASTYTGQPILADRGGFILLLVAPFYAMGGVGLLLAMQSLALGSGYLFVRKIAWEMGSSARVAHLLGLAYLIYPTVLGVNLFDFHPQVLGVPVLFGLIWAATAKRWPLFFLFSVLAVLVDVSIPLLLLGTAIVLLLRRQAVSGLITAVIAVGAGLLNISVFLPVLGHGALAAWSTYYSSLGPTPWTGVLNVVRHPAMFAVWVGQLRSWEYIVWIAAVPVAILTVARRRAFSLWWIPALLLMGANLLSPQAIKTSPFNEFTILAVPFVFAGVVDALGTKTLESVRSALVVAVPLLFLVVFGWQQGRTFWRATPPNANALRAAESVVPKDAPLVIQNFDAAHFADRAKEWLPGSAIARRIKRGTYIVLDMSASTGTTPKVVLTDLQAALTRKGQAKAVFSKNGVEVFELLRPLEPLLRGQAT